MSRGNINSALIVHPVRGYKNIHLRKGVGQYAAPLADDGKKVSVIGYEKERVENVNPEYASFNRVKQSILGYFEVLGCILFGNYDVVITQGLGPRNFLWAVGARIRGLEYVVLADYTTGKRTRQTRIHKLMLWLAMVFLGIFSNLIITQTRDTKNHLEKVGKISNPAITWIPSSLDELFVVDKSIVGDSISQESKSLLYVGRIIELKNVENIVKAFNKIKSDYPEWDLKIVGGTQSEVDVSDLDRVEFHGFLEGEELLDMYIQSDIFCLASSHESFCFSLIEAAATGNGIISTDVGIAPDLLDNAGLLLDSPDVQQISQSMLRYIEDRNLVEEDARKLYSKSEQFHSEAVYDRLVTQLEKS